MRPKAGRCYHTYRGKSHPLGPDGDPIPEETMRRYDDLERELVDPGLESVAAVMAAFRRMLDDPRNPLRLAERTRGEYARMLRPSGRLGRVFGSCRLDDILPSDIGNYLEKHDHPVMANREVALLSKMYHYAIGRGWQGHNPCIGITPNPEDPRGRYVEHWEYNAVFHFRAESEAARAIWTGATVSQQMYMALSYLYGTRTSALLRIRLADIDRNAGEILVLDKGGDKGRLVMCPETEEVIAWHLDQQVGNKPGRTARDKPTPISTERTLLRNTRGQPWSRHNWAKYWRRLMAACLAEGVIAEPFNPHDLRAKRATDLDEERFDASLALGHMDRSTTKRYLRHPKGRKIHPIVKLPTTRKKDVK